MVRRQLSAFLPPPVAERIDAVRTRFDPAMAERIGPHVTVVHDLGAASLDELEARVGRVAGGTRPFDLQLAGTRCWSSPEGGIYVVVDDSDGGLAAVRRGLSVVDPPGVEFVAHVTLVHPRTVSVAEARAAWTELSGFAVDERVTIEQLAVVELGTVWQTTARFSLGGGGD